MERFGGSNSVQCGPGEGEMVDIRLRREIMMLGREVRRDNWIG